MSGSMDDDVPRRVSFDLIRQKRAYISLTELRWVAARRAVTPDLLMAWAVATNLIAPPKVYGLTRG